MKKIPTMFVRDETKPGRPVINQIKPECQWVLDGEGIATQKMDGTNVKIQSGVLYKRQKPKEGEYSEASYVQVEPADPQNKYICEAFERLRKKKDAIYEALGPKIQGNPHGFEGHVLIPVVPIEYPDILEKAPRTFESLKAYLAEQPYEGIVFHHPDGRMAQIKRRDFGLKWPIK